MDASRKSYDVLGEELEDRVIFSEESTFTKYSPLITLLLFSIGPASNLAHDVFEAIETLIFSARFKNEPQAHFMQIVGATPLPNLIMTFVTLFFGQAITSKISKLIAEQQIEAGTQVFVDIVRISVVVCLVFPICFVGLIKPCLAFVGCPSDVIEPAFLYLLPPLLALVFETIFVIQTNFIQATGRPFLAFLARLAAMLLQVCIFSPILAFGFNCSTSCVKFSSVLTQIISSIVLFYFIMKGKFLLKPTWGMFLNDIMHSSWDAIVLAAPVVTLGIGYSLPPNIMMRCMTNADPTKKSEIMGVMGAFFTLYNVAGAFGMTFGSGFLSAGTHALGKGDNKRMMKLFGWAALFNIIPICLFSLIICASPGGIAGAFLQENEIELATRILPIPFYTMPFNSLNVLGIMFLTAVNKPIYPAIIGLLQCIFQCVGAMIMQNSVGTEVWNILHLFNFSDIAAFLAYTALIVIYMKKIIQEENDGGLLSSDIADEVREYY